MKKRKFAEGGFQDILDMSPADVAEMRAREKATKAFNRTMPDPYEMTDSKEKRRAALENAINAPMEMGRKAISKVKEFADSDKGKALGLAARLAAENSPGYQALRPGIAAAEYGIDKLKEEGANRNRDTGENTNPMGDTFKKGGKVASKYMSFSKSGKPAGMKEVKKMSDGGSASKRADGIAQRGKTRGKMC
jgi:hypothetical protein